MADYRLSGRRMGQRSSAMLLLAPFMIAYLAFLVFPFFRGIWISLNNWNLLEVAFNPDAREFVGLRNYEKILWGRNIVWSFYNFPLLQWTAALLLLVSVWLAFARKISRPLALLLVAISLVVLIACGFHPGDGGRWYDRRFWPTVGNTILFVALTVPSITAISLALAVLVNKESRVMAVFRTIFFLSQVLSVTVVTLIWQLMFSPRQGLIANVIEVFGGSPIHWLTDERFAMTAIVITTVWWSLGIAMILFLAGLQDISRDIYEAAALDNAKGWRAFRFITLPNLKRTITLVVVLQIIMHFQVFGQSHLMTGGGPNDTTQTLVRYIYQTGFRDSELGRAATMAVFLFAIMGVFSLMQFLLGREGKDD
nr:sugar ABC transporter permease [uncultured Cohaesibacter sp.]